MPPATRCWWRSAGRLREAARNTDAVLRWGGEEFLIVSRWTDRRTGEVLAERLLDAVAARAVRDRTRRGLAVTCSVGWAPYPWRPESPEAVHYEQVMSLADRALYLAKREGRNRAVGVLPGPDGGPVPEGPLEDQPGGVDPAGASMGPAGAAHGPEQPWPPPADLGALEARSRREGSSRRPDSRSYRLRRALRNLWWMCSRSIRCSRRPEPPT